MKSDNIYYRARMQAAQRDPLYASRERTACEIFVPEALPWKSANPPASA